MPIYFTGTKNAAKLSSLPASLLIVDEAEKLQRPKKDEADSLSLAMERTKSYADSLTLIASTPTIEGTKFQQLFAEGSQSRYFMPCPHCKAKMEFIFDRESVVWEEGDTESARIICPHCKK